jgi:hypothetical protein
MMKAIILIFMLSGMLTQAIAEDLPALPQTPLEDESLEREVTITQTDEQTTYEYRVNGARYMVKIVPSRGPAYYLLDLDGDGEMDTQEGDPKRIVVPQWVLFRW